MIKVAFKAERKMWECDWIKTFISSPYGNFSKISVKGFFFSSTELQVKMDQERRQKQMRDDTFSEDREQMEK